MAAALLVAALIGLVVRESAARAAGTEVRLAITGFDPRSPLSGHYMRFQIRDRGEVDGCPAPMIGSYDRHWIALRRDGVRHRAVAVAQDRESAAALGLPVQGRLYCGDGEATLDLGVDRFHASQAEAEAMQEALRAPGAAGAFAVVSIGRDGKARLKGVIINGRRTDLDWL
ncbi:GDYXXLXY domain-containing protein [Phenylobacterium sp.]|uniref:GDYXXLXY domain-containing protein n=1 Tax=Phenylobacterium sp. TaxID=1871053 RepID=UPI0035B0537A